MTHQVRHAQRISERAAVAATTSALEHAQRLSEDIRRHRSLIDRSTGITVAIFSAAGIALAVAIWARVIPAPLVGVAFGGFLALLVILLLARAAALWRFASRAEMAADRIDARLTLSLESDDLTDSSPDSREALADLVERADLDARILLDNAWDSEQQLLSDVRERVEAFGQGHETSVFLMENARADIETRLKFAQDRASDLMRRARNAAAHQLNQTHDDIELALARVRDEDSSRGEGGEALAVLLLQQYWQEARERVDAAHQDAARLLWREQIAAREIFERALRLAAGTSPDAATKDDDERG